MGDVTITLPELPEPTPPAGFRVTGYELEFTGSGAQRGEAPTLDGACKKVEHELSDRFRVYAWASGKEDQTQGHDDAMYCSWNPRANGFAGEWGEWEYA